MRNASFAAVRTLIEFNQCQCRVSCHYNIIHDLLEKLLRAA